MAYPDIFSDEFINKLPEDTIQALLKICEEFERYDKIVRPDSKVPEYYLSALGIFLAVLDTRGIDIKIPERPAIGDIDSVNNANIKNFFAIVYPSLKARANNKFLEKETSKYVDKIVVDGIYEFSDDDFKRIQTLLNEMRDIISSSKVISEKHKTRLLNRIEQFQKTLNKKTSDLDLFWSFIGESGIVIGKFGKDVKPFVDRIRELSEIVGKVIRIQEKLLPSYSPLSLPPKSENA